MESPFANCQRKLDYRINRAFSCSGLEKAPIGQKLLHWASDIRGKTNNDDSFFTKIFRKRQAIGSPGEPSER